MLSMGLIKTPLQPLKQQVRFGETKDQRKVRIDTQMHIEQDAQQVINQQLQGQPYTLQSQHANLKNNTLILGYDSGHPNPQLETQIMNDLKTMGGQRFTEQNGKLTYFDPRSQKSLEVNLLVFLPQ